MRRTILLTYPRALAIVQASWNWPFSRKDMEVYGQKGYAITVGRDEAARAASGKEEKLTEAKLWRRRTKIPSRICEPWFRRTQPGRAFILWKPT